MKVLTKALINESEEIAVKSGAFSYLTLMENAGNTAADIILKEYDIKNKRIAVICGNGNNGGDGFVIAKRLYEHGAYVTVFIPMGKPLTETASYYYNTLFPVTAKENFTENSDFDFIIDAIFGIGLNRAPDEEIEKIINACNHSKAVKIAVDIPSGVETDSGKVFTTAFQADLTITFIALKPCFMLPKGSDFCGKVMVADIGVEPYGYAFLTNEKPTLLKRVHNSHKGTFGTALLICGSYGMAGAAILSARAALRSGVGIAKCIICESIYSAFTCAVPEAVSIPTKQTKKGVLNYRKLNTKKALNNVSAILIGCGLGVDKNIKELTKYLIKHSFVPLVIDADGINNICDCIELLKESKAPIILTPHPREMSRLVKKSVPQIEADRISSAKNFSKNFGCITVLKGADTIIAEPDGTITINTNGNSGMATGGSGDVLSGIIVSLLAQGMPPQDAVKAAVYLHAEAGDNAKLKRGERSMLPSDIIEEL